MKRIQCIQIATALIILLFPCMLHAQPDFGDDVDDVPIDGGLSLLVATGIGYGVNKIKSLKSNNKNQL